MTTEQKNIIDKSVSVIGIKRVKDSILKGLAYYNLDIKKDKEVLDYLDHLLSIERENKLSIILSERRVLSFNQFSKSF
jgi:hypothetical protein